MLIFLESTPEQLAAADHEALTSLVVELLYSSRSGNQLVIFDRRTCDWLSNNLNLSPREFAQISRLKEAYSQRGRLLAISLSHLILTLEDQHLIEYEPNKYRIGYRHFLNTRYFEPTRLLVEHVENDGEFLDLIIRETLRQHPAPNFSYLALHGGGGDIAACLRVEIPQRRIVVCVVDSDKVAPCDTMSPTKRNLDREAGRQSFVGLVLETPCKEAENYIPLSLLRDYQHRLCPDFGCFEVLQALLDQQTCDGKSDCLWLFFDVKKGLQAEKLDAIQYPPVVSWLHERYQLDGRAFSDINIDGFGDGLLRQFLNCGEAVREFVSFMKSSYWKVHFSEFFDLICWYLASEKKPRSI